MNLPTKEDKSSKAKEVLDLSHQSLAVIPAELSRFHNLRTLRLNDNSLEEVNWKLLMEMAFLTSVNLSRNRIKHLPAVLGEWDRLETLDLTYNLISEVNCRLWPLWRAVESVLVLTAPEHFREADKEVTRLLRDHFGKHLPKEIRIDTSALQLTNRRLMFIEHRAGDKLPTLHWYRPRPGIPRATIGEETITRSKAHRRILLAENPVLQSNVLLASNWETQVEDWEAACKEQDEADSDDSSSDPETDRRKESRANTRHDRREHRLKSKANRDNRSAKMAP